MNNKKLNELEKHVMHDGGTEPAFTGEYWNTKESGEYSCKNCGQVLFNSNTKLDSRRGLIGLQGWPAFANAVEDSVNFTDDYSGGMHRIEARCSKCDIHLGHVFNNVEGEGSNHFCINSCTLDFKKEDK